MIRSANVQAVVNPLKGVIEAGEHHVFPGVVDRVVPDREVGIVDIGHRESGSEVIPGSAGDPYGAVTVKSQAVQHGFGQCFGAAAAEVGAGQQRVEIDVELCHESVIGGVSGRHVGGRGGGESP